MLAVSIAGVNLIHIQPFKVKDTGVQPRKIVQAVNEGTPDEWRGNKTELTETRFRA